MKLSHVTWRTAFAARLNLYVWILEWSVAKTSLSHFLSMRFAQATIGGALGPIRPLAPVPFDT